MLCKRLYILYSPARKLGMYVFFRSSKNYTFQLKALLISEIFCNFNKKIIMVEHKYTILCGRNFNIKLINFSEKNKKIEVSIILAIVIKK